MKSGLTKARRIRDVGFSSGTLMVVQEAGGSQISDAAILQLAQSIPEHLCHFVWIPGANYISEDITAADGIGDVIDGRFSAIRGPGVLMPG